MYTIKAGKYEFMGETQEEILRDFCADLGAELSKRSSVINLGRGLYGDAFRNGDQIDIANGVIVSLMNISMNFRCSKVGVAFDIIDILLWVATIATVGASVYGNVVQAGVAGINASNAAFWAKQGVHKVSTENAKKLAAGQIKRNAIRAVGYKTLNTLHNVAPEAMVTVGEFLKSIGIQCPGKAMAISAVTGASVISKEVLTGIKDLTVYCLAKGSKNSLNDDGTFDLSVQLTKQRVKNIVDALRELGDQILNNTDEILNSNILVCALDRRNLNTWLPGLCLVNRLNEPQQSFLKFIKVDGVISPKVMERKEKFLPLLNKIKEILKNKDESNEYIKKLVELKSTNNDLKKGE